MPDNPASAVDDPASVTPPSVASDNEATIDDDDADDADAIEGSSSDITLRTSMLSTCDEEVKTLDVTRVFDFGQFIELFDVASLSGTAMPSRVVLQPGSELAADRPPSVARSAQAMISSRGHAAHANGYRGDRQEAVHQVPEVDLLALLDGGPAEPVIAIDDDTRYASGEIEIKGDGRIYRTTLTDDDAASLDAGETVRLVARWTDERNAENQTAIRLRREVSPETMTRDQLARIISGEPADGDKAFDLAPSQRLALLRGERISTISRDGDRMVPVSLVMEQAPPTITETAYNILDIETFLASPALPATDGSLVDVKMTTAEIQGLMDRQTVQIQHEGKTLTLKPQDPEIPAVPGIAPPVVPDATPTAEAFLASLKPKDMTKYISSLHERLDRYNTNPDYISVNDRVPNPAITQQQMLPTGTGLGVAVFVPWRQTWSLKGFSRGNLLSSIALAPAEQLTMEIRSWERESATLEQSSETESETQTEVAQTTRDTEDVFKEMLSKRDFTLQASASVDASFEWSVATINTAGDFSVNDTTNLEQTCRNSRQNLRESTIKASSRVRSKRVTKIVQTRESGREERVTREIRNPNPCRTLTLDFFETLAHYEIGIVFVPSRMRLVVLVPNPVTVPYFTSEIIRRNETALRKALIETALVDGFAACRMTAAYQKAKLLVEQQKAQDARDTNLSDQRDKKLDTGVPKPWEAAQKELVRIVTEVARKMGAISADADIHPAFGAISIWSSSPRPVLPSEKTKAQHWLFLNLCNHLFPSLVQELSRIGEKVSKKEQVTEADAIALVATLPGQDAPTKLSTLAQMPEKQKEDICLTAVMKEWDTTSNRRRYMNDIDWHAFTERMRSQGLYTPLDEGVINLCDKLSTALRDYETKQALGDAMLSQEVVNAKAEQAQSKQSSEDRLSMAFPLDELSRAQEREEALRDHLNEHKSYYNFALFQVLPPAIQVTEIFEASQGKLPIGLFEPRVIALAGDRLVVPLTPIAGTNSLQAFIAALKANLEAAFEGSEDDPDHVVMPTPGVSVSTRLGQCSACEPDVLSAMQNDLRRGAALALQEEHEAERRKGLIDAGKLDPFVGPDTVITWPDGLVRSEGSGPR